MPKRLATFVVSCPCGGMMTPVEATIGELERGRKCIWCAKHLDRGERTREHLNPRGLGGSDRQDNIATACSPCNNGRNEVLNFKSYVDRILERFASISEMKGREAALFMSFLRRAWNKLEAAEELRLYWVELEHRQIGWSPHEKISFWLPSIAECERLLGWDNGVQTWAAWQALADQEEPRSEEQEVLRPAGD